MLDDLTMLATLPVDQNAVEKAQVEDADKDKAAAATAENLGRLEELQYKMYADGRFAMLVALQAIDGGGKDSTIRRVFGAFNPQGCTVTAFKAPVAAPDASRTISPNPINFVSLVIPASCNAFELTQALWPS